MICIYCTEEKIEFNREHVLPRALGTFQNNLVLSDLVCKDCNDYFGRGLDRFLARGSLEAVRRLERGVREASAAADLQRERITFRAVLPGRWNRVILTLVDFGGTLAVAPVPQVGFLRAPTEYVYLTEREIRDVTRELPPVLEGEDSLHVVATTTEDLVRLEGALRERGLPFKSRGVTPPPQGEDVGVEIATVFDDMLRRAVAKIAFNYLAHVTSREFLLSRDFDMVRRFVRKGERPDHRLVAPSTTPILQDESGSWRRSTGHIVKVEWTSDKRGIVGDVYLFSEVRYRVLLSRWVGGVWREIARGHAFDLQERQVTELTPIRRELLP